MYIPPVTNLTQSTPTIVDNPILGTNTLSNDFIFTSFFTGIYEICIK